jgi:hypothetical protein
MDAAVVGVCVGNGKSNAPPERNERACPQLGSFSPPEFSLGKTCRGLDEIVKDLEENNDE